MAPAPANKLTAPTTGQVRTWQDDDEPRLLDSLQVLGDPQHDDDAENCDSTTRVISVGPVTVVAWSPQGESDLDRRLKERLANVLDS